MSEEKNSKKYVSTESTKFKSLNKITRYKSRFSLRHTISQSYHEQKYTAEKRFRMRYVYIVFLSNCQGEDKPYFSLPIVYLLDISIIDFDAVTKSTHTEA